MYEAPPAAMDMPIRDKPALKKDALWAAQRSPMAGAKIVRAAKIP